MSWNISGGLVRKLNDRSISSKLLREWFIFLSETQMQRDWKIHLQQVFTIYRKDRLKGKAGGVAWLVHTEFDEFVGVLLFCSLI